MRGGGLTTTGPSRHPIELVLTRPTPPNAPTAASTARPARITGLDGLRATAVIAVILYHADIEWARGGFIGVDVFFVLSGYLMATVTLEAVRRHGGLGLRRFWVGRIRRLTPAQVAMMAVITVAVLVFYRDELATLRPQVIFGLLASMNWWLIVEQQSYFDQLGRPPILRHLWSLSIEMQFYVVFPPLLAALMTKTRLRRDQIVIGLLVLSAASAVWMAFLFDPAGDPSRAYYDTFARLCAPLIGAALALVWQPGDLRRAPAMGAGTKAMAIALVSFFLLVGLCSRVGDQDAWMYRGGFLFVAIVSAAVIAGITHPGSPLGGKYLFGNPVLVAIGLRSYCLYLWHWPIFALIRPRVDVEWSWATTFTVRILLTVLATELTYRLIERPWHQRAAGASLKGLVTLGTPTPGQAPWRPAAKLWPLGVMVVAVVALACAPPATDEAAESLAAGSAVVTDTVPLTTPDGEPTATTAPAGETTTTLDPAADKTVTFIGDSVMLGAAGQLVERFGPTTRVNAEVSRQASAYPEIIRALAAQAPLGGRVVVQAGNNGTLSAEEMAAIREAAGEAKLYFLTVRVPRSWEDDVNATIAEQAPELDDTEIIDWHGRSDGNLSWFYDDGTHLNADGQTAFADVVEQAIGK